MSGLGELSPHLGPTQLAAGHAPPTPPHEDPLDDIYGSAPASPALSGAGPLSLDHPRGRAYEILSDLPSRQRALDTEAYREGLANSKGQYVQEGFDEGYSLGANLGMRVGYILGVMKGFVAAWKNNNHDLYQDTQKKFEAAQAELAIQELLGQQWVDEDGIWNWDVQGVEEEPTFREVAEQHPIVHKWTTIIEDLARRWSVDLRAVEKVHGASADVHGASEEAEA